MICSTNPYNNKGRQTMQDPKNFILAGKSIFTIEINPDHAKKAKTKDHYTFKVTTFGKEKFSLWLLTGTDNLSDYSYVGMLNKNTGQIYLTSKSHYHENSLPVRIARWAFSLIWRREELPEGYKFHHEGRCGRCGRTLTTPESISSGFGPVCAPLALTAGF